MKVIKEHCNEPGIRSLQKYTKKIVEKIAYNFVKEAKQNE